MSDLSTLTHADFAAHLGQRFAVDPGAGARLELELVEVLPRGAPDARRQTRQPFSLVFRGPGEPVLSQQIYPLLHPALGRLEIFLVPIGDDGGAIRYEAVFS